MRRRIVIAAFDGFVALDAIGPAEAFRGCADARGPLYDVTLASMGGGAQRTSVGFDVVTADLAHVRPRPRDTVLVPGGDERATIAAMTNPDLLRWLQRAARVVERVTSVCSGSFILAAAGLLDGKRAATHWSACDRLQAMFPRVKVDASAIYVNDGRVWTSAGVTTGIDMALAIIEADHGAALASQVAAAMVLYLRRPGFQSQFSDGLVSQIASSAPLARAVAWVRAHLAEATVETLARAAGLSVRTLHRRCLEHLEVTPAQLIARLRVEHARALLATTRMPTKELAAQCGFGSATHMRRACERALGMGPREYRLLHSVRA